MSPFSIYGGPRLIDTEMVGDPYEDWSGVRSPARARRRRARGFFQRIKIRYRPNGKAIHDKANGVIYIHPVDRLRVEAELARRQKGSCS
jgi:hypothetical protein